jgi:crotonobetainyl-CoA:carnitine CoA-transferase CaiB-like acyl-CoA transferase
MLAGRILADLGADVVVLEPPAGAAGRRMAPFLDSEPGLERSLTWHGLNYNKRGMTLNLDHPEGISLLSQLAAHFDVVIHTTRPGQPGPLDAVAFPPHVIRTIIRPFSKFGPKAEYLSTELILMAANGATGLAGEPDRAPLFFPTPQAPMEAGAEAAVVTLGAIMARDRDGLGQVAEVSNRTAATAPALGRIIAGFSGDKLPVRTYTPGGALSGIVAARPMYPCQDGFIMLQIALNGGFVGMTGRMADWLVALGELEPKFRGFDWSVCGRVGASAEGQAALEALIAAVERACAAMRKSELTAAARAHGFMAAPVMDMNDIAAFPHFRARGLFAPLALDSHRAPVEAPARFAKLDSDPVEIRKPAPRLSEHTSEVLRTLDLSPLEIEALFIHEVI